MRREEKDESRGGGMSERMAESDCRKEKHFSEKLRDEDERTQKDAKR